jgi:predicted TIM-barrel fold metal-dependent hydrolase
MPDQIIIDCHVHAGEIGTHYPRWWVEELYRVWGGQDKWAGARANMSPGERFVDQMNEIGIDMMCIMSSDHRRVYADVEGPYTPNDHLLEIRAAAPERFALTCGLDPLRDLYGSIRELEKCVREWGFTACKLYPTYDHFDPRDRTLYPVYEKLIELDVPMQIHMGWTPCLNAPMKYQQPYLLDDVCQQFPDLKIVIAHMGWPWVDECMALVAKWENVHADIAYWAWFDHEFVFNTIIRFGQLCGFHKLLYGSENSHTNIAPRMMLGLNEVGKRLNKDPIPQSAMDLIMWKNASSLWKIDTSKLSLRKRAPQR